MPVSAASPGKLSCCSCSLDAASFYSSSNHLDGAFQLERASGCKDLRRVQVPLIPELDVTLEYVNLEAQVRGILKHASQEENNFFPRDQKDINLTNLNSHSQKISRKRKRCSKNFRQ